MPDPVDQVLRGEAANWAMRCLLRDMTRELRSNGKVPPPFAQEVLEALATAAGERVPDTGAASGTRIATVVTTSWVSVHEAAARHGLSERYIRRLAQTRAIRAQRPGRDWQIDPDSLTNVLRRAA